MAERQSEDRRTPTEPGKRRMPQRDRQDEAGEGSFRDAETPVNNKKYLEDETRDGKQKEPESDEEG